MDNKDKAFLTKIIVSGMGVVVFCVFFGMWGCPQYNVYERRLAGEAELAQATYNRQVKVREAEAVKESSVQLAQAEIERARGVAEANKIIGKSLEGNEAYLKYLWIHSLTEGKNETIYIPTEANLPILEASRKNRIPLPNDESKRPSP